jgi:uncharacterized protein involved in exopolysaccharide biosynthesis
VTVRKVADRLASLFVDENLRDRSVMAEGTSQFLEAQLADAKAMLRETELKREAYNRRYSGELPSQLNSNLAQLNAVLGQIQQFTDSLDRDRERHTFLEQQLVALETTNLPVAVVAPGDGGASVAAAAGGTAQQLAAARAQLEALATRFQPGHPDRASAERRVRDLERKYDEELRLMPAGESMRDLTPAELDRRRRMADLQGQLQALDKQMAEKQEGRQRLQLRAEDLQTRVDAVPARESELIELNRDYEVLQERYTSLLAKKSDADMSANLERRQIGEQFRVLDPARLPERPFSPNRQRIMLAGMGLGFGLGVLLVGLLEYRDTTFKTDEDISVSLGLPVVAVVPLMESAADHQRAVRRRLAVHAGLGATVFACVLVFVYALVR